MVEPDQTVGFWMRRMALETAIHRVDADLAAGLAGPPIAPDLAADGIDEVLGWIAYAPVAWPEDFTEVLATADPTPVRISTGGHDWTISAAPGRVVVDHGTADPAAVGATVSGAPDAVYRWIWGRGRSVAIDGDARLVTQLKAILAPVQ